MCSARSLFFSTQPKVTVVAKDVHFDCCNWCCLWVHTAAKHMRIPVPASLPSHRGVQGWSFLMWSRWWWLCSSPSHVDGEDKIWCWYPSTLQMHSLPSCGCGITVPQSLSLCIKQYFLASCALEKRENLVLKTHSESFALHQFRLCQAVALVQVKINK